MIIIATPHTDFDPTETAVPWKVLTRAGYGVRFATPSGRQGEADPRVVTGEGFGPLRAFFAAHTDGVATYEELRRQESFRNPIAYEDIREEEFDGLLLPGGHAPGMREYLESEALQRCVASFFAVNKPVGAICHGVIVPARARMPRGDRSPLYGRRTTALPAFMELSAYWSTRPWLHDYFRTYPETVQRIVSRELADGRDFLRGPLSPRRDSAEAPGRGFAVVDGNYISARWPGDAYRFAYGFLGILERYHRTAA
ncbi:MAG: type 1 glutamine amidotransferase domain-containing protein [Actinomycetota bacterium]